MSDPRTTQNAARLSEDIGDVLSAIRRLIAEDEALAEVRPGRADDAIDEDAGDFLARRYGGNAALARRLAGSEEAGGAGYRQPARLAEVVARDAEDEFQDEVDGDSWPLGSLANAPEAARPALVAAPQAAAARILRHDIAEERVAAPRVQNDLARSLSASLREDSAAPQHEDRVPGLSLAAVPLPAEATFQRAAGVDGGAPPSFVTPLRLDAARRVPAAHDETPAASRNSSGWRSWIRPEPPLQRRVIFAPPVVQMADEPRAAAATTEEDGFAEAFDWKARMRPDPVATAPEAAPEDPAGADSPVLRAVRRSGWVDADAHSAEQPAPAAREADLAQTAGVPHRQAAFSEVMEALDSADAEAVSEAVSLAPEAAQATADIQAPAAGQGALAEAPPEADEESIRELLRDMIREELHGELGERFSRNLRAVIRREVASAIEDFLDRV